MMESIWTMENLLVLIPLVGTTVATLIIAVLTWKKNNKIHILVNSARSEMLRELLSVRINVARLSGLPEDVKRAEEALIKLEHAEKADREADKL